MTDQTPATEAGRTWLAEEYGDVPPIEAVNAVLAIEAEARAGYEPSEGREALWDKFTSGEKLAYGCGRRDGRNEARADALREAADAVRDAAVERGDDTVHIRTLLAILDPRG